MGLEISLVVIGAGIFAVSFIFSAKMDNADEVKNAELSQQQKDAVAKQITVVMDEQLDDLKDKAEIELDRLSNVKMNEMNEYSETILGEINRNHNEVMFLYDMLNEKKKEVNNTVRDIMAVKKELNDTVKAASDNSQSAPSLDKGKEQKTTAPKSSGKSSKKKVLDQLDAVADTVSDDIPADEEAVLVKPKRKIQTGKTAASRARNTVKKETEREENKDISVFGNGNNNEKILELNARGKSNVEIAKELGLGIGEVKLVIDLFRGGR